jgi:hypothetical protein
MREIVIDTETTGLNLLDDHRPARRGKIRETSDGCLQSNLSRDGRGQAGGPRSPLGKS